MSAHDRRSKVFMELERARFDRYIELTLAGTRTDAAIDIIDEEVPLVDSPLRRSNSHGGTATSATDTEEVER